MRAAVDGVDGVGERIDRLGVGVGVLDGGFGADAFHLFLDVNHRVQRFAVAVQIADEGGDAAFEIELHFMVGALVHEIDRDAACDERHLAEALGQRVEAIIDLFLEDLLVEFIGDLGAGLTRP